jgi:hypothetical protein
MARLWLGLKPLDLEMVMIPRQDVGMDPWAKACRHPGEQLPERLVCLVVRKHPLVVDSTIHDVVPAVLHADG